MFKAVITDDRGRRVPLVADGLTVHFGRGDSERSARLRRASSLPPEPATRRDVVRGVAYGLLTLPVLLAGALAPAYFAFHLKMPWWVTIPALMPMGIIPGAVTVFIARRTAGRRIARVHVHAGFCGSCGYDLTGTEADVDGCRVCPECGAAWRFAGDTPQEQT